MSVSPPPTAGRRSATTAALSLASLHAAVGTVSAQLSPPDSTEVGVGLLLEALGGAFLSLVVCGLLLLVARSYVERTTDRALEKPVSAFLYGLGLVLVGLVVAVLLTLTVVGVVLVVPLVVSALVFGQLGYLAAARVVVDDPRLVLVVAAGIGGFTAGVPVVGVPVGAVLVCVGIGAWYLDARGDGPTATDDGPVGFDPTGGEVAGGVSSVGVGAGDAEAAGGPGGPSGDDAGTDGTAPGRDGGDADPADEWTAGFEAESDRE